MTKEQAQRIAAHLIAHGLAFCFMNSTGELITREYLTEAYGLAFPV